jgi:hypothetical protein
MVANTDQPMAMERQEDSPVMLSAAKHLDAQCDRPFAAAQGDTRRKQQACPCCHAERSEASQRPLQQTLRCGSG